MSGGVKVFFGGRYCGDCVKFSKTFPQKDDEKKKVPVLVVFGWGARSLTPYMKPLLSLSKTKCVLVANTVFPDSPVLCSSDVYGLKARLLLRELKKCGVEKTDVVACSEGAIITAFAATLEPGIFRNIVFVNPAGFGEPRNPFEFVFAYVKELFSGVLDAIKQGVFWKKTARVGNGTVRRFITHPLRSLREASSIAQTDVRFLLPILKEKGIRVSFLLAENDSLFPPKKIRAGISENLFVEMRENKGRHANFITEETDTVIEMLSVLENRRV